MELPMTSQNLRTLPLALALAALASGPLAADDAADHGEPECSDATLRGAYGIQMSGTRPSAPGGPMEAMTGVVIRHYDGEGGFTQVDNVKGSISGWVPDRPGAGTYTVSADCTGATHFQPGPGQTIEERFVVVDRGREVRSMVATPAPVMVTTVQKLIARR
jgi:hypothetical protein